MAVSDVMFSGINDPLIDMTGLWIDVEYECAM
jgi:hypothetical protein